MLLVRRWFGGAMLVAVAPLVACSSGASSGVSSGSSAPRQDAFTAFTRAFDDGVGHRRLVLLMSPT
jgi:hypothetical protein